MSSKQNKKYRRAIFEYLKTGNSKEGKKYFESWFTGFIKDQKTGYYQPDEDEGKLEERIKSSIDRKIEYHSFKEKEIILNKEKRFFSAQFYLWAASVTLIMGLLSALYFYMNAEPEALNQVPVAVFNSSKATFGEKRKLTLQDGTIVYLNSGSEFRYPDRFSNERRDVYLTGEAYFQVSEDKTRPFVVHSGAIKTTVLGTSFNICAFDDQSELSVTVVSGKVKVDLESGSDSKAKTVLLTKNLEARYSKADQQLTHYRTNANESILWKDNVLNFNNKTLSEIEVILERWFNIEIRIIDDELGEYTYVGKHNNPTMYQILEALHFSTGIEYEIFENEVILKKK